MINQETELSYIRFGLESVIQQSNQVLQHLDSYQGVITLNSSAPKRRGRKPAGALNSAGALGTPTFTPKRRGRKPKAQSTSNGNGNASPSNGRRRGRKPKAQSNLETTISHVGQPVARPAGE